MTHEEALIKDITNYMHDKISIFDLEDGDLDYHATEISCLCATYQDEGSNVNELKNAFTIGDDATCTGYFLAMKDKDAQIKEIIDILVDYGGGMCANEPLDVVAIMLINLFATYQDDEWISVTLNKIVADIKSKECSHYNGYQATFNNGLCTAIKCVEKAIPQPPTRKQE